jgi:hypothetical protein
MKIQALTKGGGFSLKNGAGTLAGPVDGRFLSNKRDTSWSTSAQSELYDIESLSGQEYHIIINSK